MGVLEPIPHEHWSCVVHRILRLASGASELLRGDLSICVPKHMDTFMEFQSRFLPPISEWEPLIHTIFIHGESTHDHHRRDKLFLCTVLLSLSSLCLCFCLAPSCLMVPYYCCVSVCLCVFQESTLISPCLNSDWCYNWQDLKCCFFWHNYNYL